MPPDGGQGELGNLREGKVARVNFRQSAGLPVAADGSPRARPPWAALMRARPTPRPRPGGARTWPCGRCGWPWSAAAGSWSGRSGSARRRACPDLRLGQARPHPPRGPPTPAADGTATWSLTTLRRALRAAPDGLPAVSTFTIRRTLREAGYTFQRTRTWCPTGSAVRRRKAGVVTVTDPDAGPKKTDRHGVGGGPAAVNVRSE